MRSKVLTRGTYAGDTARTPSIQLYTDWRVAPIACEIRTTEKSITTARRPNSPPKLRGERAIADFIFVLYTLLKGELPPPSHH